VKNPHEPALVWPPSLKRPLTGRPVVYLGLNHWISLTKAAVGHEQGESFKDALDTCRAAAVCASATFVLAAAHYFEVLKVASPRQRHDIADVMESLTGFRTLVDRVTVMKLELAAALDFVLRLTGRDPEIDLIGHEVCHAFGKSNGGFRIRDRATGEDVTPQFRENYGPEKFDADMANALLELERSPLRGPRRRSRRRGAAAARPPRAGASAHVHRPLGEAAGGVVDREGADRALQGPQPAPGHARGTAGMDPPGWMIRLRGGWPNEPRA
jgi:hypothetical protein